MWKKIPLFFPLLPRRSLSASLQLPRGATNRQFSPMYLSSSSRILCVNRQAEKVGYLSHSSPNRRGKRVFCGNIWLYFCITKPAEANVILLCCGTLTNQMVNDYDTCIVHGQWSRSPNVCVCVCVCVSMFWLGRGRGVNTVQLSALFGKQSHWDIQEHGGAFLASWL